jgi:hypothetical protein
VGGGFIIDDEIYAYLRGREVRISTFGNGQVTLELSEPSLRRRWIGWWRRRFVRFRGRRQIDPAALLG